MNAMKILAISPQLPYPPATGGKKGIYDPLRSLAARGHHIHLACLMEHDEAQAARELAALFPVDAVVHSKRATIGGAFASLLNRTPYQLSRFHDPELLERCRKILSSGRFDVIQIEGVQAAWYGLRLGAEFHLPVVLRVHDVLSSLMWRSIRFHLNPAMKLWLMFDAVRVRAFEKNTYGRMAMNMAVSEAERNLILRIQPKAHARVVSCGVNLSDYVPCENQEEENSVLWIGAFHHAPNRDSFRWFYHEIIPRIAEKNRRVRIRVIGSGAPKEVVNLRHPNVEVLGYVEDFRPMMARAGVCVVPLRVGSGVRIKLLEMFAMRKAVVSTALGAEGLGLENGKQLLLAETAESFADCVVALLGNGTLRRAIANTAHEHAVRYFSITSSAKQYEGVYDKLCLRDAESGRLDRALRFR